MRLETGSIRAARAAVLSLGFVLCAGPAGADSSRTADVLVQAGHEGRPDCNVEPASLCNNTGAPGEVAWTPIVADIATRTLRAAGISVLREPGHLTGPYHVREAVFLHFDGSTEPCSSGPSVGFPTGALAKYGPNSAAAAAQWRALYGTVIPFRFEADNFTEHLATYYGYHHVFASDASILIEGSEISCPAQRAWQARNLEREGKLIAAFVARRLGRTLAP